MKDIYRGKMTAYNCFDGWFDSSNTYRPDLKEGREVCVKDIAGYIEGMCEMYGYEVPDDVNALADKMYSLVIEWEQANEDGNWSRNWCTCLEKPLSEIVFKPLDNEKN